MMFTKQALMALAMAVSVRAHLTIAKPAPFAGTGKPPLDPSGSNFPCQGLTSGTNTDIAAGSPQTLEFDLGGGANTAVHGGGSCQISVSTDMKEWYVINSYEGACPADAAGNLATAVACTSPGQKECMNTLSYTIPAESVPNGKMFLAWTWFNRIGNREMYMNCAAITVSGGKGTADTLKQLPTIMKANIGSQSGTCATTEGQNVKFPNPGKQVTTVGTASAPPGDCGSAGSGGSPPPSSASASASAPAATSASSPATSSVAAAPPAQTSTAVTTPAGSGSCAQGSVPCTGSGFQCVSAQQYMQCANGCGIPQPVAAGTSCTDGKIAFAKRAMRRSNFGLY